MTNAAVVDAQPMPAVEPGADADLLLLDPHTLEVRACFVGGQLAYADAELHGSLWFHA